LKDDQGSVKIGEDCSELLAGSWPVGPAEPAGQRFRARQAADGPEVSQAGQTAGEASTMTI